MPPSTALMLPLKGLRLTQLTKYEMMKKMPIFLTSVALDVIIVSYNKCTVKSTQIINRVAI